MIIAQLRMSVGFFFTLLLLGCSQTNDQPANEPLSDVQRIHPESWPSQAPPLERDPAMEAAIADLLSRMTLEEKVGQVMQADISDVTPDEVREFNLGSVLNGGNSAPGGDNRAAPDRWLALADEFWDASTDRSDGGVGIPTIWGTDAMHGHSNVVGATLFPHNIGLGMVNDPDMMYDIGGITALEMRATGLDWTFAPTVAVVRDDRWGRTYESFSEDPKIVAAYAPRIVEGLQGTLGTDEFLDADHTIATAKHYVGDGGTIDGIDQGNNVSSEDDLRNLHAAGYYPAVNAGVQTVMASYNSYHGRKIHGFQEMLTDVLVGRIGFDGFVVGDWNGHGQVAGCTKTDCSTSFNAGLDMFMAPNSWKGLYYATLDQVRSGEIREERLDEAVSRILRVKMRAGIFDAGRPSSRKYAGNFDLLGAPAHRSVAREAVRKSLVLLKNDAGALPISPAANILVTGDGAHDIGKQSGGWTLSWQGTDNRNEHFPNGMSIYEGFRAAVANHGGTATLSEDGSFDSRPDVAVVVFGEDPYAEGVGDRPHVDYASDDGLNLLRQFREAGIPTVSVFLSGRPLWVNPELNASDAFVAAWLPGSEGGGIADVLLSDVDGKPVYDFDGRLSFSWPRSATQTSVNVGDPDYDPLFPYGYGLTYGSDGELGILPEASGLDESALASRYSLLEFGDPAGGWKLILHDMGGDTLVLDPQSSSPLGNVTIAAADHEVQEDTIILEWSGAASIVLAGSPVDLSAAAREGNVLELRYRVVAHDGGDVHIQMGSDSGNRAAVDVVSAFNEQAGQGWQTGRLRLTCFAEHGVRMGFVDEPLVITADAGLGLQLKSARIVPDPGGASCDL